MMKYKPLFVITLLLLLSACASASPEPTITPTATTQPTPLPTPVVTPRVVMIASDPQTFQRNAGKPQLIEFFTFW